jgi:hypothetical protein
MFLRGDADGLQTEAFVSKSHKTWHLITASRELFLP